MTFALKNQNNEKRFVSVKFLQRRSSYCCSCMSLPSSCPLSTCLTSFRCFRFFRTISLCFFYQHEFLVSTLQTFLSPLPLLIPYVFRIFFRPVSRNILTKLYWDTCTISILLKTQHFSCFFAQISVISVSGIFQVFLQIWQLFRADMAIL